jgi:hypothetical protein
MKLYQYKSLDVGFAVLCPDRNPGILRITVNGIRSRYKGATVVAAVPEDTRDEEFQAMSLVCPTYRGTDTITSLINVGMNNSPSPWTITVMCGSHVRANLDKKFSYFVDSTKDVLFPIAEGRTNFVDGTINGIMIHKDAWDAAGNFCNQNPLGICKLLWTLDAIRKGCVFKAVIGAQIV